MTDTTITATVFPQDDGTGVPEGDESYDSAGNFGMLSQATPLRENVLASGDVITYHGDGTASFGPLLAFAPGTGAEEIQVDSEDHDTGLGDNMVYVVSIPSQTNPVTLEASATSDVYLAFDPTQKNEAYIRHGSSVSAPADPHLYLGTVDTSNGSVEDRWAVTAPIHHWGNDDAGAMFSIGRDDVGWSHGKLLEIVGNGNVVGVMNFSQAGGDSVEWQMRDGDGNTWFQVHSTNGWDVFPSINSDIEMRDNNILWGRAKDTGNGLRYKGTSTAVFLAQGVSGADPSNLHGFDAQVDGTTYWKMGWRGDGSSVVETFFRTEQYRGEAVSAEPSDPPPGEYVRWLSDGTGPGNDGDMMLKITDSSGTTKTVTDVDFSAI